MDRERSRRSRGGSAPRWIVPLLLSLPLAIVVLGLGACLPVPLGDPETSRVDPRFAGVWTTADADKPENVVAVIPFDGRTYLVVSAKVRFDEGGDAFVESKGQYKAWLTTIAKHTFITLEPLYLREALEPRDDVPGYLIARITLSEDGNHAGVRGIDPKFPALAPLRALPGHLEYERPAEGEAAPEPMSADEARALLRRVITENVDNDKLYTDELYVRVTNKAVLKALFRDVLGD